MMRLSVSRLITLTVGVFGLSLLAALLLAPAPVRARATAYDPFDATATYKAKCVVCHGAAGEKRFDKTKADDPLIAAIMAGKKGEKPPNMPAYGEKGITADQAKALVAYMKQL
jgi:mono/diheme cytochrome c family protein